MRITVKIKTNAKCESVEETGERTYLVRVRSQPIDGKANKELIDVVSRHFNVRKSDVSILRGQTNKIKVLEIA